MRSLDAFSLSINVVWRHSFDNTRWQRLLAHHHSARLRSAALAAVASLTICETFSAASLPPRCELKLVLRLAVLDILHKLHDPEHVGIAGKLDSVDGEPDRDAGGKKLAGLRHAETDAQLAEGRNADRGAGSLDRRDLLLGDH